MGQISDITAVRTKELVTLNSYLPTIQSQLLNGDSLIGVLNKAGYIKTKLLADDQTIIRVLLPNNQNGRNFGGMERLTSTTTDSVRAARTYRAHYTISFQISDIDRLNNAGPEKMKDLLQTKIEEMKLCMEDDLCHQFAGMRGTDVNRSEGLGDVFGGADPDVTLGTAGQWNLGTSTSSLHGRAVADFSTIRMTNVWAPIVEDTTAFGTNSVNMRTQLITISRYAKIAKSRLKLGLCDGVYWQNLALSQPTAGMPVSSSMDRPAADRTLDLGVPAIKFNGITFVHDEYIVKPSTILADAAADGHAKILGQPEYLSFVIDNRMNMKMFTPRARAGSDEIFADTYRMVHRWELQCPRRSAHALAAIDAA